jgi:hypothetical protein
MEVNVTMTARFSPEALDVLKRAGAVTVTLLEQRG